MTFEELARENIGALSSGDMDRFVGHYSDDSVATEMATGREFHGGDAIGEAAQGWKRAFPDMAGEITNVFSTDDDQGVVEVIWRGTHTGPLTTPDGQTIPPTNRTFENPACYVCTVRAGKILERREYGDIAAIMGQLGLMP